MIKLLIRLLTAYKNETIQYYIPNFYEYIKKMNRKTVPFDTNGLESITESL